MNIVCAYWGGFERLAGVLAESVRAHAGGDLRMIPVREPVQNRVIRPELMWHAAQVQAWRDAAMELPDGPAVFIDADTMVLKPLDGAFEAMAEHEADLAYTVRPARYRANLGVLYVDLGRRTRAFMADWHDQTQDALLRDWREIDRMIRDWASIDQATFMQVLPMVESIELPCSIYNSVDQTWHTYGDQTRVVHVKGALRQLVMTGALPSGVKLEPHLEALASQWHQLEAGVLEREAQGAAT